MAYFSNSTEGDWYEEHVCHYCTHYSDGEDEICPVWFIHLMHNGAPKDGEINLVLETLIPSRDIYQGMCTMFLPKKAEDKGHVTRYNLWLERTIARAQEKKKLDTSGDKPI